MKEHQTSRADAKEAMATATTRQENEAAAYAKQKADRKERTAALEEAMTAIETGRAGSFIQAPAAKSLENYAAEKADLPDISPCLPLGTPCSKECKQQWQSKGRKKKLAIKQSWWALIKLLRYVCYEFDLWIHFVR